MRCRCFVKRPIFRVHVHVFVVLLLYVNVWFLYSTGKKLNLNRLPGECHSKFMYICIYVDLWIIFSLIIKLNSCLYTGHISGLSPAGVRRLSPWRCVINNWCVWFQSDDLCSLYSATLFMCMRVCLDLVFKQMCSVQWSQTRT